jgi:TonB family protein
MSRRGIFISTFVALFFCVTNASGQTCQLKIGAILAEPANFAEEIAVRSGSTPITDYSAYAVHKTTGKKYVSVLIREMRDFGEIPKGLYRVYVSKPGYKTTIQAVELSCLKDYPFSGFVKLWKGRSTQTVNVNDPAKLVVEMRLDRITKLGSTDSDTGYRVVQPGESYKSGAACKGPLPNTVSGGVLNGKALSLPKPVYPPAARAVKATGAVSIQVLIDENGNVVSANAVSGHPLLRAAAESAARSSTFSPTLVCGQPVKVSGVITYNFVP